MYRRVMLNVLINAYAVSPNWGSEPGMGWNWIVNIAKYCNVFVITEGEWHHEIEDAVAKLPHKENLHFYYLPNSDKVRQMCWNQGDWRFYWYYRKWQKRAYRKALEIIAENKIDVIHQLNMIGFREPGYLWKIKDIPFVWGPVGGMGTIPLAYLKGSGWRKSIFCRVKNLISDFQAKYSPRVRAAVNRGAMIAATKEVKEKVHAIYGMDIPLINETGCYQSVNDNIIREGCITNTFEIIWVGRFIPTKKLDLALQIIANLKSDNVKLKVCGGGTEEQIRYYRNLSIDLGIEDKVEWMGRVEHSKIISLMSGSDLFLFTSIMEATSTVVLEAIEAGLPIVSFNTCGFGPLVEQFAGKAIPLSEPEESSRLFAETIDHLIAHPEELQAISRNQCKNRHLLTWENKALEVYKIYTNQLEIGE